MTRRVYFYFTLTFLLGIVVGAAGGYIYNSRVRRRPQGFDPQRIARHLKEELNLTDPQAQQVMDILTDAGKKYADLQKQNEPQFAAVREESRERIRKILTPEQIAKFNEIVRRVDERRRQHAPR